MKLKLFNVVLVLSSMFAFLNARAGADSIQDVSVSNVVISRDFNLRAVDGSIVSLQTSADSGNAALESLPAPTPAARTAKCSITQFNASLEGKLINMMSANLLGKPLTASERAIIANTPRCGLYLTFLKTVATLRLGISSTSDVPSSISLSNANGGTLILKMSSGKVVDFQIQGNLYAVDGVPSIDQIIAQPASSGQAIGVVFTEDGSSTDGSPTTTQESCTYQYEEQICRDPNQIDCHTRYISEPGHQIVSTSLISNSAEMELTDAYGNALLTATVSDANFDSNNSGECLPGPVTN